MRILFQHIRLHAIAHPARPAVMLPDRVITYGMLQSGIDSVRQVLTDLRLDPDSCVGVLIDNPGRHLIIALSLIANGHAFAPLRADLVPAAKATGVAIVITDSPLPADCAMRAIFVDEKWFMNQNAAVRPLPPSHPNRVIKIGFTSGSTGRPKAIAYTERAQLARIQGMYLVGMSRNERIMSAYGMSGPGFQQALQALSCGRTICFAPIPDIVRVMAYYNVTELRGSVGQVRSIMLENEAVGRPISLRQVSAGGAYLPDDLAKDIRASFGAELICPYSSVEAGSIGCAAGDLIKLREQRGNCFNIITNLEIVDDDGKVLPDGVEGRIRIRSPQTNRPFMGRLVEPSGACDEWTYLTDVARIDPDGLLILTGRSDEVINFGGAKVDPEVIENALRSHPAIEDAAALRMLADNGAEECWVVAKTRGAITLESLNAWLAARLIGELGAFQFARLEIVNEIPRTAAAKVARGALRESFMN